MKKQVLFLVAIMLNCNFLLAQNRWINANANGKYGETGNWDGGYVPDSFDQVIFVGNLNATNCDITDVQEGGWFEIGNGGTPYGSVIVKNGGKLEGKFDHWSAVGWTTEAKLIVESGGVFSVASHLWLGFNPNSKSYVSLSGTINVGGMFGMNFENLASANAIGDLTINNGGVLNLAQLHNGGNSIRGSKMVIKIMGGGKINITGNYTSILATHIAANQIVAPGGSVLVEYNASTDMTVITSTAPELSVKDFSSLDFSTYPNPVTNYINVNAKAVISNVKIYNNLAQLVREETGKSGIDISGLSSGFYTIKVTDELGNFGVKKIIKQ